MRRALPIFASLLVLASGARATPCGGPASPPDRAPALVLAEGDSITFGQGATDGRSFVQRACVPATGPVEAIDTARPRAALGSPGDAASVNSLFGRLEDDARLIFDRRAGRPVLLTVLIGRNDLVGYAGGATAYANDLVRYVAAMRAAGVDRVVVGTLLPSDWAPFTAARGALNAILRRPGWATAHGIDAVADFAASPIMGSDVAARDRTLYVDGIHPTDRGYDILAPIYASAVAAALARGSAPR